jgi:hypothetical protein
VSVEIGILRLAYQLKDESGGTCTAFYMPWKGKTFLVTAKHFTSKASGKLQLRMDEQWLDLPDSVKSCSQPNVDIAAIDITGKKDFVFKDIVVPAYSTAEIAIGDERYFLGFPYEMKWTVSFLETPNEKLTFPLLKKAVISGALLENERKGIGFYLDGHNNPGFSGGPCLKRLIDGTWKLFAVVSSYVPQQNMLYDKDGNAKMIISENSGIFVAHSIVHMTNEL